MDNMKNQIKLIKTEKDYEEALKLSDKLFDAEPDRSFDSAL